MMHEVTKMLRGKKRLWKRARCVLEEMRKYKEADKAATAVRNAKINFENRLTKEKVKNIKSFYAYIKGKTQSRVTIRPLLGKDRTLTSDNVEMAEVLNDFFAGFFCHKVAGECRKLKR
jgi:hypothetical protein